MLTELLSGAVHADSTENMGGLVFDRIPKPRVSAMDSLLTGFNFILSLNEFTYGFQNISNIQRHREVRYHQEGGVNDHQIMVGAPNDNTYTLSLRRGYIIHGPDDIISTAALAAAARIPNEMARKAALIAINSSSPQIALERGPSLGFIQVYSRRKKLIAMFSFLSLGMTDWTFSDLDAQSSEAVFENITIAHTGLTLLPATWMPSVAQPIMNLAGVTEDSMATMTAIIEKNKEEFEKRQAKIKELEKTKSKLDKERIGFLHQLDEITKQREEAYAEKNADQKAISDAQKEQDAKSKEQIKKNEEKAQENQKDEAKNVGERAEAREKAQAEKKEDYDKRMDAQKARTEKQNAQDKENVAKVQKSNKEAQERMNSENEK